VLHERAHARLDALILDDRDGDPARVLEARAEEVHDPLLAVPKAHVDLAEAVARDLAGNLVLLRERSAAPRSHARDQGIERALATLVAGLLGAADDLERAKIGLLEQEIEHERLERLRLRRASHAALRRLR